mmetsp:Transcript_10264/g.43191  ORF Transcript_10264/g.43191 Transcript_10264/m.43191 type:complete len:307 (+) Transcript_10264:1397-2317(+)
MGGSARVSMNPTAPMYVIHRCDVSRPRCLFPRRARKKKRFFFARRRLVGKRRRRQFFSFGRRRVRRWGEFRAGPSRIVGGRGRLSLSSRSSRVFRRATNGTDALTMRGGGLFPNIMSNRSTNDRSDDGKSPYAPQHFLSSLMFVVCTAAPFTTILETFVTSPPPWLSSTKKDTTRTFWNCVKSSSMTSPVVTCAWVRVSVAVAFFPQLSKLRLGLFTKIFTVLGAVPSAGPWIATELRFTICLKGTVSINCSSSSLWQNKPPSSRYPCFKALPQSLPVAWFRHSTLGRSISSRRSASVTPIAAGGA